MLEDTTKFEATAPMSHFENLLGTVTFRDSSVVPAILSAESTAFFLFPF